MNSIIHLIHNIITEVVQFWCHTKWGLLENMSVTCVGTFVLNLFERFEIMLDFIFLLDDNLL